MPFLHVFGQVSVGVDLVERLLGYVVDSAQLGHDAQALALCLLDAHGALVKCAINQPYACLQIETDM